MPLPSSLWSIRFSIPVTTKTVMSVFPILFLVLGRVSPVITSSKESSLDRKVMVDVAGYGEDKISIVLVTGSVLCDVNTYGDGPIHRISQPVSGAVVALNCHSSRKLITRSSLEGVTDEFGDFTIDLPSHLHAIPDLHKKCFLKLLQVPKELSCHCAYEPSSKHQKGMMLLAAEDDGVRTYSVGTIRLQHPILHHI